MMLKTYLKPNCRSCLHLSVCRFVGVGLDLLRHDPRWDIDGRCDEYLVDPRRGGVERLFKIKRLNE